MEGKDVIPVDDMLAKIRAACSAREDEDLVIMARTDALAVHGLDEAIRRGILYAEAGADLIFVEAVRSRDEMGLVNREIPTPTLANMIELGQG